MNNSPGSFQNDSILESGDAGWNFDHTYIKLPDVLYAKATPARFSSPAIYLLNEALAAHLGLDFSFYSQQQLGQIFTGQVLPRDAAPVALAYAGHQFGGFTFLGDGRALLLGEHLTSSGERVDIQFKGSGPTPFSRRGDGLAALGPMIREYLISEAMHHLGIPSTRSLAVAVTGEPVYRDKPLRGAVLTRVAASHLRVGTFQLLAAKKDHITLKALADYAIARHYPDLINSQDKYIQFIYAVAERQAKLIAMWQGVGFVHGVMNTDNMSIAGETIDYGPCAFLDVYHSEAVFSSIDHQGRYAYVNQPVIAQWNLVRLTESLIPLINEDSQKAFSLAQDLVSKFPAMFDEQWIKQMSLKIGLAKTKAEDVKLIRDLLDTMQHLNLDFTNTFRLLSDENLPTESLRQDPIFQDWMRRWQKRLNEDGESPQSVRTIMNRVNPYIIPRNHLVEEALLSAEICDNLEPLNEILAALSKPFEENPLHSKFRETPPVDFQRSYRTFCGT